MTHTPDKAFYRAAILDPVSPSSWRYIPDGGLLVERGRIASCGPVAAVGPEAEVPPQELDGVLVPGFIDLHLHWVQHAVRGRFHGDLLSWLERHIYPEEARFADPVHARACARAFFADVLRAGTVGGMAYSSIHLEALRIAREEARGRWVAGNVLMDDGDRLPPHPAALLEEARAWGPDGYAVSPRFALSCSAGLLEAAGRLARELGCFVQTHLAESPAEVAAVARAFPEAADYTDVYDRAGLLGPRTVLGHCIHLSEREWNCLLERGCWIAHCPSSNEALDSGRMDLEAVRRHGIPWALGSDVGAGPSVSMLHVMQRFLAVHAAAGVSVTAREALYRATLAGARCLGAGEELGSLRPGRAAHFVLLPWPRGTRDPGGALREVMAGGPAELESRPLGTWLWGRRLAPPA